MSFQEKNRSHWYCRFQFRGKKIKIAGFNTEAASNDLENKLRKYADLVESGAFIAPETRKWVDGLPPRIKNKLIKHSLLDSSVMMATSPIGDIYQKYDTKLKLAKNSEHHIKQIRRFFDIVVKNLQLKTLRDISGDKFEELLDRSGTEVIDGANRIWSASTQNHCLIIWRTFLKYCIQMNFLEKSPIQFIKQKNVAIDKKHERRVLSQDDFDKFIKTTKSGPSIRCLSGKFWALVFEFASKTGLRWSEICSLKLSSFNLSDSVPHVKLLAGDGKIKRDTEIILIHSSLLSPLLAHISSLGKFDPSTRVFGCIENKVATEVIRKALRNAGIPYRVNSELVEVKTRYKSGKIVSNLRERKGLVYDFHSLRCQFATDLRRSGVSDGDASKLMRHSNVNLTRKLYTKLGLDDKQALIERLPSIKSA